MKSVLIQVIHTLLDNACGQLTTSLVLSFDPTSLLVTVNVLLTAYYCGDL